MQRAYRQIISGVLIISMLFAVSCGRKEGAGKRDPEQGPTGGTGSVLAQDMDVEEYADPVWTYKMETVDYGAEELMTGGNMLWYTSMRQFGDDLYYAIDQEFDEETQTFGFCFCRYSVQDKSSERVTGIIHEPRGLSPQKYDIGEDGSIYASYFWQESAGSGYMDKMYLVKWDAGGAPIYTLDLAETLAVRSREDELGNDIGVYGDGSGGVCLVCQKKLLFFDGEGRLTGSMDPGEDRKGSAIYFAGRGKDGTLYVNLAVREADGGNQNFLMAVDFDSRTFRAVSDDFSHTGPLNAGVEKDFLQNVTRTSTLYDYDLATQSGEALLYWYDYGYTGQDVKSAGVTSDGKILAVVNTGKNMDATVLLFTKALFEKKTELVLGTVVYSSDVQEVVTKFNRDSDRYHIRIRDYFGGRDWTAETAEDAWSKMTLELAAGKGPDIINLYSEQISALAKQGFLEDLQPYLEQSAVIGADDFVDHVLECAVYDGKLAVLPRQFNLRTVIGHASDARKGGGWTRDEFMAFVEQHSGAQVLTRSGKAELLNFCMAYDTSVFVDREAGKCNFNDPEFIRLLEFANRYGGVTAEDDSIDAWPENMQKRNILLSSTYLSDLQWPQLENMFFNGEAYAVGYPSDDGKPLHYISLEQSCGISANARNKEGAWAFLEFAATMKKEKYSSPFPALKRVLEEQIQEELADVSYKLDDNREQVLDENGDPIPERRTTGGTGYGNWRFEYLSLTKEEAEQTMEIIRTARPYPVEEAEIQAIINEEVEAFFDGSKSAAQVADVIQNRVQLYLFENQ